MCVCQWCQLSPAVIQYCANLINADKRINGTQIGDCEIKIVNFTDNTTIFLRDITCLNRIQVILRLYGKDKLVQRIFFQKPGLYGMLHIKTEFINQNNWNSHNFHSNT